nr:PREDICTED: centrosome-associated protein 350-like isoform X2 [Megachile rotundata]
MKSNSKKEDTDKKKKYVFFSDPDVIVQGAETSAATAGTLVCEKHQDHITEQTSKDKVSNLSIAFNLKDLKNLCHPIQPYPFTFINAVKRKLAVDNGSEACKKIYDQYNKNAIKSSITVLKPESCQNLHEIVKKMDFIRPLKVPDLKISAKKLDFSDRENCVSKELISPKFETPSKEFIHERVDKPTKSFERVQRKLDFSTSDVSSTINSEVEPLKVPNISISSNLSRKKDYIRENSREKENRSKRIRKDDSLSLQDEATQDLFKRSRSPRHVSRKDFPNNVCENMSATKLKSDRLPLYIPRESDFALTKPKTKNFATSTAKKANDKKHRSSNTRSLKSRDVSLESKNRSCSNESLSEYSSKLSDKITIRESKNMEYFDTRYIDDLHMLKQANDQKHVLSLENRQLKQHKVIYHSQGKNENTPFKEQTKKLSEKIKPSMNKMDNKIYIINSKESEDGESITDSNTIVRTQSPSTSSIQQIKNKDSEKAAQGINILKSSKNNEDLKYTDDSSQSTAANIKKEEESFTQSVTTTKPTSNSNESNLNDSILSEKLLDPRRISFRDENRLQEEFCNLITPDMNLIPRSKRKRQFIQNSNIEVDPKCSKHNTGKIETEPEGISLLHPTALHMQFQAELHLLDSFNESLRQVMDVEKCLYNVKQNQEKELPLQHSQLSDQVKLHFSKDERNIDNMEHCSEISKSHKNVSTDKDTIHHTTSQTMTNKFDNFSKLSKPAVKAVEVQTQTVNDIATQTDVRSTRRNVQSRCSEICGTSYERGFVGDSEIPQLSLDSVEQFEDLDQIEEISLPSKLRTMSEISLHETTSSIRTETGTEISISTRDVTCSFNKYLDLEIAQLLKDEKQRYDKIEMLFKSREKTLNDQTKKLVKLEEQKRALKDTGQDSRVSSVKKKQRALLLKLQQEKDEMNRLKELHKIASQERKLMLQKQRNMFNPQMSTKNILTKLKRSADSQSPRRLSGPMKGYDIRSNSSMSSLVDSDKSQHDRSQTDTRMQMSENELHFSKIDLPKSNKFANFVEESNAAFLRFDKPSESIQGNISQEKCPYKIQKDGSKSKYEIKSRKFEEKMPKTDIFRLKSHQHSADPTLMSSHSMSSPGKYLFDKDKSPDVSELLQQNLNKSISEQIKSESDTLIEELSKKSKSQMIDSHFQNVSPRERESLKTIGMNSESVPEEISSLNQDTVSKTSKSSQVSEDILQTHSKSSKKSSKSIPSEMSKKTYSSESKSNFKRKSSKCQKSKSSSSILTENILRSKSNSQISEELIKHLNKRTKMEKEFTQSDKTNENSLLDNMNYDESSSQTVTRHSKSIKDNNFKLLTEGTDNHESKESVLCQKVFDKNVQAYENSFNTNKSEHSLDNVSVKSQISNFAISRHSSEESDKNYSKSVVIRSQDQNLKTSKKLEQILNAREAALTSRKNCVEEWMAWHAKLRTEEDRVARMEQAALKLVTATSNVFSHQERSVCPFVDTTISSDTSDVEGRIELLTEKLAERRIEMSRLKREARKQTKQKLRALEANLLNQIKKYDTTIHEMRRKLESKKGSTKDSDKLAIESKSLADFKVPEIPLKRIQDIFKNNDLLRSRSESDLLCTKSLSMKDCMKHINLIRNKNVDTEYDKSDSDRVIKSFRRTRTSEQSNSAKASTICDENISEQIEIDKIGSASMSSISDDVDEIQNNSVVSEAKRTNSSEEVKTEISGGKSETDIPTQSEAKLSGNETTIQSDLREYKSDFETISEQSKAKSISSQSTVNKIQDNKSCVPSEKSSNQSSHVEVNAKSANEMFDVSKKLDFLCLSNQNLNEDISSLENELKILSEMMSRFNNKSNERRKQELQSEEKSTSKDISEILSKSDRNDEIYNIEIIKQDKSVDTELYKQENTSDTSQCITNSAKLKSATIASDRESIAEEVDNVISAIIPPDETSFSKSNQEIDYEARSKEILNEIEKSIISEHIKVSENDVNRSEIKTDYNDISAHENNTRSLSEIYSRSIQGKESANNSESQQAHSIEQDVDINAAESLINSRNSEGHRSLEFNKNSSSSLEVSNLIEKDHKPSNIYTVNNVLIDTADVTSAKLTRNIAKQIPIIERETKLSEKQISQQASNSTEISENFEESLENYTNDITNHNRQQSISEVLPLSKGDSSKLTSKEFNDDNKNEALFVHDEHVDLEVSPTKLETSKYDTSNHDISFNGKEIDKHDSQIKQISIDKTSVDKDNWTISDSFDIQQDVTNSSWEKSHYSKDVSHLTDSSKHQISEENIVNDVEDVFSFVPKSESSHIDQHDINFHETALGSDIEKGNKQVNNLLNIIGTYSYKEQDQDETVHSIETDDFQKAIYDSVVKILDKVEKSIEDNSIKEKIESHSDVLQNKNEVKITEDEEIKLISCNSDLKDVLQNENNMKFDENEEPVSVDIKNSENINKNVTVNKIHVDLTTGVNLYTEIEQDEDIYDAENKSQEIIITELEPGSAESESLSELEIDVKIELAEEEPMEINNEEEKIETRVKIVQEQNSLEPILEQDSSDGEQLDNLVEVAESGLDVIEKRIEHFIDSVAESDSISHHKTDIEITEVSENEIKSQKDTLISAVADDLKIAKHYEVITSNSPNNIVNKTFDILKDPEYEDISEESLEVSEIFDKSELQKSAVIQKPSSIPEKYEAIHKSEEVLKILDEITQKSSTDLDYNVNKFRDDKHALEDSEKSQTEISDKDDIMSSEVDDKVVGSILKKNDQSLMYNVDNEVVEIIASKDITLSSNDEEKKKLEQDALSESSECRNTPKDVSEIEIDSSRDPNDSRLDVDALNDDLLNNTNVENQNADSKNTYHATPIVATSEKDIEVMIDKLKASLEQPGVEVADWEAKLLRIEQLQIELEIKKLEAEEVTYYVREIPNKPPPPYTPPGGGGRISTSLASPSPPPAVIPSNIDELTAFTEKATAIIFKAKEAGEDIMRLEAPLEICELTKENDETVKKDRRIYNTFLFDLCKETIAEVYQAEYEKPGPSWTKPNVKTKPIMKIPKTIEELNAYVNKEVATLFGFKTKLQRENMVMRWSRKRRDRVDELLAREAQAEEDEWTKFHHDELAVKNGLTVTILDTLIMETVNVVKVAYAKKRKVMV